MRLRTAAVLVNLVLLAASASAQAQPGGKAYRIGFLSGGTADTVAPIRSIVIDALRGLGYREGQNLLVLDRYAGGRFDRLPALAAELLRLDVDVIMTRVGEATRR